MPRLDHDGIFLLLCGDPRFVRDLLVGFVGSWLDDLLDWSTLKQTGTRHISEGLAHSENDMVWEVRTRQDEVIYVYLMLEFQSSTDWMMSLRMLNYVGQFYRGLSGRADIRQQKTLPEVLPVVLYNGEAPWTAARDISDLIKSGLPGLEGSGLRMRYKLVDVWRSPALDRALRNLADAVFRLQRVKSLEACRQEVTSLEAWMDGEEYASLRRSVVTLITKVLLPSRLPGAKFPEVQSFAQLGRILEGEEVTTWTEQIEAKGLVKGRIALLEKLARQKFGEASANAMAALLGSVTSEAVLDDVGIWLLKCSSGEAFLAKIRNV